jgi:PAS domain S-box-containing protein
LPVAYALLVPSAILSSIPARGHQGRDIASDLARIVLCFLILGRIFHIVPGQWGFLPTLRPPGTLTITESKDRGVTQTTLESSFENTRNRRRAIRDLADISALVKVWLDCDRVGVAVRLADALVRMLGLRFAYVRLCGPAESDCPEAVHTSEGVAQAEEARAVRECLHPWLSAKLPIIESTASPLASEVVGLSILPLGCNEGSGLLVAASERPGFPSEEEQLLLSVAASQAAIIVERRLAQEERDRAEAHQRQLLQEVEAERRRLAEVLDLSPAYTAVLTGPGHVFERVNGRYYQLGGERDLIGKPAREALPEVEGQGFFELLDRVYRTGEPFVGTDKRVMLRRDPRGPLEARYVDFVYLPLRDANGAVSGIVSHGVDLTDRKRGEEVQSLLAAIVESSEDAIVSKTLEGQILSWNAGAERIFGYTAQEIVGRPITVIIPPERIDEERSILERIRRGVRVDHFETVRVSKQGRRLDISLTISPIRDAAGTIIAASKVARDITDRKLAEAALREADKRKEQFIALLAHELRNPLAPLRNSLNTMRLAAGDREVIDSARAMMERQLSHMVRLVDDLLDISRISQNKFELRRSRVALADVVSSAVETARPLIDAAGHKLTITLPDRPIFLDADLTRLAQVFGNLLSNSAKYTDKGGRIWLTGEERQSQAVVTVRDTGIGIPAEDIPRIFDMFAQVDRTSERTIGGLGIGLALVKGLVEMHGGSVTVESSGPDQGSTFTVTLPMLDSEPPPLEPALPTAFPIDAEPKRRILVVDDNRDSALSMAVMLKLLGNEVRIAHDGVQAVELAESFRPEVVLMDVGMPRLNGYEATRRIKEHQWGKKQIIVALTGWGQVGDRLESQAAGCDGHLVKPVNLDDLQKLLTDVAGQHTRAPALQEP